jgi:hypothetical protein
MTVKEFKEKDLPKFDYELYNEDKVLVQIYLDKKEIASKLIGVDKAASEIKNLFKVLKVHKNFEDLKEGDVVSLEDSYIEPPIVSWKNPEGNDPNKEARPVYGTALQNLMTFSFDTIKTGDEERLELVFLIPHQLITVKHN